MTFNLAVFKCGIHLLIIHWNPGGHQNGESIAVGFRSDIRLVSEVEQIAYQYDSVQVYETELQTHRQMDPSRSYILLSDELELELTSP